MYPEHHRLELLLRASLGNVWRLDIDEEAILRSSPILRTFRPKCGSVQYLPSLRVETRVMPALWLISIWDSAESPRLEVAVSDIRVASRGDCNLVRRYGDGGSRLTLVRGLSAEHWERYITVRGSLEV